MKIQPVIMSGGSGTRLWPASRADMPKQFQTLINTQTLLQDTLQRVSDTKQFSRPLIIANQNHLNLIRAQTQKINQSLERLILEPSGRNTAPAVAVAALYALRQPTEPELQLILAADHHIAKQKPFLEAIKLGTQAALNGRIVTFGIVPDKPETGYGYIKARKNEITQGCYAISAFKEKPDYQTASQWLKEGGYSWNSGMFLFKPRVMVEQMEIYCPKLLYGCRAILDELSLDDSQEALMLPRDAFEKLPALPIDVAVMEQTEIGAVVPVNMGWSDVGSWASLYELATKDLDGNVVSGDVFVEQAKRNYIAAQSRLVVASGVEDLIIVETADAVMVVSRHDGQAVKNIVARLKQEGRDEAVRHLQAQMKDT